MGNVLIPPQSKEVHFSLKDKIIEYNADKSPGQEKPVYTGEQDTNFEKKEKPVKKPKEARNLFWEDENKLQNVQSEGGHRRLVRQRSQPVLWVEKEEPFSRRTLDELKKIGEEFAKLSKPSGFER